MESTIVILPERKIMNINNLLFALSTLARELLIDIYGFIDRINKDDNIHEREAQQNIKRMFTLYNKV